MLGCLAAFSATEPLHSGQVALEPLQRPVALPSDISVSPDGTKIFFVERAREVQQTASALDIASASRFTLPGHDGGFRSTTLPGRLFKVEWSGDSRQLAILDFQDSVLSFVRHNATRRELPSRTSLVDFSRGPLTSARIVNWMWLSESNQLLLSTLEHSRLRLFRVDLGTQKWTELAGSHELRTDLGDSRLGDTLLRMRRGRQPGTLLFSINERKIEPRSHKRDREYGVYELDLETDEVRLLSRGDLVDFLPGRLPGELIVAFDDGSLSLDRMPERDTFFYLGRLSPAATQPERLLSTPVSAPRFFASERRNSVYVLEDSRPERNLIELNIDTGRRRLLNSGQLSVTEAAVSGSGRTIATVLENVNTPPEIYVRTHSQPRWRKLTHYGERLHELEPGDVQKLTWRSRDDRFDVDGLLVRALGTRIPRRLVEPYRMTVLDDRQPKEIDLP